MTVAGAPIPITAQVAMSTAITLIAAANIDRQFLGITNPSTAASVYIGGSTVLSSTNGYYLPPGGTLEVRAPGLTTGAFYGTSAGTPTLTTIAW